MMRSEQSCSSQPSAQMWTFLGSSFALYIEDHTAATRLVMELSDYGMPGWKEFQPSSSLTPLFGSRRKRFVQKSHS